MKRITVLLIIGVTFLCACSTTRWNRQTVVQDKDFIVTLEQQEVEDRIIGQKYDHPYQIGLQDLKKLMADLSYTEKSGLLGKEKQKPVFQTVEINRLAPVLADALAKADDSQRIRFTSFNQGKALIFSVSRETEGVMFLESGGPLNIAFSFINSEIDPTETTAYPAGFSKVDPLKTRTSGINIIPAAPYAELYVFDDGKPAPMWVVADLQKLNQAAETAPVPPAAVETETDMAPAAPVATPPVTETGKTAPVPTSEDMLQQDIKNKLKYLKELLDEGLISEQDYNAKKMELLEKID